VRILALDPAEYRVGWARGESGTKPVISVYKLRNKDERTEDAIDRFAVWLYDQLIEHQIELLAAEHFLPSGAKTGSTTDLTKEGLIGLNYAARSVAAVAKVHFRSPMPQTIRKHFCGRAFANAPRRIGDPLRTSQQQKADRDATKAMVVRQAQLLGYIPKDCEEDNMADAAALFDFASSHFASKAAAFQLVSTP
jgi:hypothetical protein